MKRLPLLVLLLFLAVASSAQDAFRFTASAAVSHKVSYLSWQRADSAACYMLYRQYPHQAFMPVAVTTDTFFFDTLRRTLCADTVGYTLAALRSADTLWADTARILHADNLPTAPCSLRLCTVDTLLRQLRLSWYPSPDTDIFGYYICMGTPCRDYDTVFGRLNTAYLCSDTLSDTLLHSFRILAFDSCYQASPLTPYYHQPLLTAHAEPCSRLLRFSWEPYVNMPDSVARYCLHIRLQGQADEILVTRPAGAPCQYDTLLDDLAVTRLSAYLSVHNTADTLCALSAPVQYAFHLADTASFLRIAELRYNDLDPSVILGIDFDTSFPADSCHLFRATLPDGAWQCVASLPLAAGQSSVAYTDAAISRAAEGYCYRAALPDRCHQRLSYSDTVRLLLPPVGDATAYFPNVISRADPAVARFCPVLISPLSAGYSLEIYNRHGERVFRTADPAQCWDGTDLAGRPLPQGVYIYQSRCRHADGSTRLYKGTVLLLD